MRTDELRAFWDEPDEFRARTGKVAVWAGSDEQQSHDRYWSDDVQMQTVRHLVAPLELPKKAKVVDFGCGVGRITRQLLRMGHVVRAVDVSMMMLDHARKYCREFGARVKFHQTDGYGCGNIPDGWAHGAVSVCTFQHMLDWRMIRGCVDDLFRVLRRDGRAHIQFSVAGAAAEGDASGFRGLAQPPEVITPVLREAGFQILSLEQSGHPNFRYAVLRKP